MHTQSARRDLLHQVAAAQAGLVTAKQLEEIGIPRSTVAHRSRPGGMWSRVLPGIHKVSGGRPDQLQREMAALLYAGEMAMLTGITALRHHDPRLVSRRWLPDDDFVVEQVHVLVPHERRRISVSFVDVERTTLLPPPESVVKSAGLALAPVARSVCDAARRMRTESDVVALVVAAVRLGLTTPGELRAEAAVCQRRGSRFLRAAVEHAAAGVWSPSEAQLRELLRVGSLPEPLWNPRVTGSSGEFLGIPDAWLDDVAMAIEVDSREHHSDDDGWRRTLDRQARYAAAGIVCVPVTPLQIRDHAALTLDRIERAYQAAKARPRPLVDASLVVVRSEGTRTITSWAG